MLLFRILHFIIFINKPKINKCMPENNIKKSQIYKVVDYNDEGYGVLNDMPADTTLAAYTCIGDEIKVNKKRRKKKKRYAVDYELTNPSEKRIKPKCKHFQNCGGCFLQHVSYEDQIQFKKDKLKRLLNKDVEVIKSPIIFEHKNRMDITISNHGIGFRKKGSWYKIEEINECPVFTKKINEILKGLKRYIEDYKLTSWNLKYHKGFMKYIVVRIGKFTNELMVNIITGKEDDNQKISEDITNYIKANSIVWSINDSITDVSFGNIKKVWGKNYITEILEDTKYIIHPNSFFQTNSHQANNLLKEVEKNINGKTILDLYCGCGTFAIYLANKGFECTGYELNPESIETAKINAKINNVKVNFFIGNDKEFGKICNLKDFDTVILDPPRCGLHPKLIQTILKEKPKHIIYVSCNPKTLRDNLIELKHNYDIEKITGIDMFPHTPHVECVCKLTLK